MNDDYAELPEDLPCPHDDGAAAHLEGVRLPDLTLSSTAGDPVRLADLTHRYVIYIYPMTGQPGTALPEDWDTIPGARGCTPQACSFRDHHAELGALDAGVFGLSSQTTPYQKEVRDRLHLPFELLSDPDFRLRQALGLPTFVAGPTQFYKRLTLIAASARIVKVFYPVFPPDRNADEVVAWLKGGDPSGQI